MIWKIPDNTVRVFLESDGFYCGECCDYGWYEICLWAQDKDGVNSLLWADRLDYNDYPSDEEKSELRRKIIDVLNAYSLDKNCLTDCDVQLGKITELDSSCVSDWEFEQKINTDTPGVD